MRWKITGMLCLCLLSSPALSEVIFNASVAEARLDAAELRLIFSRQRLFWTNGQAIRVFILPPDSEDHRQFCQNSLDVLPYMLQRNWDRAVYSGMADRPEIVSSIAEMRRKVFSTAGAVGYVPDEISATGSSE
ncbi:hypothetical protein JYB88_02380 [Shewanella cyperi]|uniref:PBP domain-containing protein n=1 Tax=Shewanella cyperi TaxID=2814292 RepID=A0A974XLE1_9GAMM|nr:hypothetical protein [Shewanella cyperi]QSX30529.1 hypothetical protein JYB88_02380 [Shewanella cyperi]